MRGEITFLPPRTSTTDSVGITTWPILSASPNACTRPSRLSFTFFSKPEYVCTMYHCFDMTSFISMAVKIVVHENVQAAENSIRDPEIQAKEGNGHGHHDRRGPDILARRPIHQPHLNAHVVQETPHALPAGAQLPQRLHQRKP